MYNCAHLRSTNESLTFEYGGTGWYWLVILGQYEAVMVGTWWYWVSLGRYFLVLGDTGPVWVSTG